jgi:hypothetical protein
LQSLLFGEEDIVKDFFHIVASIFPRRPPKSPRAKHQRAFLMKGAFRITDRQWTRRQEEIGIIYEYNSIL